LSNALPPGRPTTCQMSRGMKGLEIDRAINYISPNHKPTSRDLRGRSLDVWRNLQGKHSRHLKTLPCS